MQTLIAVCTLPGHFGFPATSPAVYKTRLNLFGVSALLLVRHPENDIVC